MPHGVIGDFHGGAIFLYGLALFVRGIRVSFSIACPNRPILPRISREVGGYASREYLECASPAAATYWLPRSEGGLVLEGIPGTPYTDTRGAYPLFAVANWDALDRDLSEVADWVSLRGVPDPLTAPSPERLRSTFPDLCRAYKTHHIVNLGGGYEGPYAAGHRRNLRKAKRQNTVVRLVDPASAHGDWVSLYSGLIQTRAIAGPARLCPMELAAHLRLSCVTAYRAESEGIAVAMSLWIRDEDRLYYHLGAASEAGYASGAMFAMFDQALAEAGESGVKRVLLGAGAGMEGDPSDGLNRFKAGWANASATAFLCGRIFDSDAYARLSAGRQGNYFPAYRGERQAAMATI